MIGERSWGGWVERGPRLVTDVCIRLSAAVLVHSHLRAGWGARGCVTAVPVVSLHGLVGCIAGQWGFHACSRVGRDRLQQKGLGSNGASTGLGGRH